MIDRIEYHVEHAVDYVQTATQVRTVPADPFKSSDPNVGLSFYSQK